MIEVHITRLPNGAGLDLPSYASADAAGLDLRAAVEATLAPGQRAMIATGFAIARGDRIAQMVITPVTRATLTEVAALDDTARGSGGFGSTGKT